MGAGLEAMFGTTEEEHQILFLNADVDEDGVITLQDAAYILTYYAQKGAGMEPVWEEIVGVD